MHHHLVVLFTQYTGLRPEDADVSAVHILKWPRVLPIALQQVKRRTHARKALGQSSSQTPKPESVLTPAFTVYTRLFILPRSTSESYILDRRVKIRGRNDEANEIGSYVIHRIPEKLHLVPGHVARLHHK